MVCRFCGRDLPAQGAVRERLSPPSPAAPSEGRRVEGPEERLWAGRPALLAHFGKVVAGTLLILAALAAFILQLSLIAAGAALVLGLALFATAWVGILRYRYELTTERAIAREGLFSQTTSEIQLEHVRNVIVQKSFSDRLLGLGTVALSTAGQSGMEIAFRSVRDPQALVRLINVQID